MFLKWLELVAGWDLDGSLVNELWKGSFKWATGGLVVKQRILKDLLVMDVRSLLTLLKNLNYCHANNNYKYFKIGLCEASNVQAAV